MFNVHQYEQKLKEKQEIDKMKSQYINQLSKRKKINEKLTQNYKKRVENFIIQMMEHPIVVNQHQNKTDKIREEDPYKFLGDPQLYVSGFKHEKDRIKVSLERNSDLDYFPNLTAGHYQFRDRNMDKEIHPDMRFTAKTSLERIQQEIKNHMQTQVENVDYREERKKKNQEQGDSISIWDNDKIMPASFKKRALIARDIAKNLLPSLHNKTHFQAVQMLQTNAQLSNLQKVRSQPNFNVNQAASEINQYGEDPQQQQQPANKDSNKPLKSSLQKSKSKEPINKVVSINEINTNLDQQESESGRLLKQAQIKTDQMEQFNPVETSKKILFDCNVTRIKNPKVKVIHPGEGHLIGMNDLSISEIYDQLYSKKGTSHQKLPSIGQQQPQIPKQKN